MSREDQLAAQIQQAEAELAALGRAREETLARLAALRASDPTTSGPPQLRLPIVEGATVPRTGAQKIRLFRSLFRGRTDVFPKRWENAKQARSGYEDLKIQDGSAAATALERVLFGTDDADRAALREELLLYCERDTMAMVKLYEHLETLRSS